MVMAKSKKEFDLVPLIAKVKENPILYDTSHEDYGDILKTNRAWNSIARELLLPNGEVVRCKWKSTCEIYLKSLKGNKNVAAISPWAEHMKYFEPYLTNGKKSDKQNDDTATSTPSKKSVPSKRQRSPVEVTTGHRYSRSMASVEEELGETDSPMKKSRISVLEEMTESKVTSTKGTPKKSGTLKTSSQRLSRSALQARESQVSINEEDSESSNSPQKVGTISFNKTLNVSPSKTVVITPEMKKGPRRLPRSALRALEAQAEASNTEEYEQGRSSPPPSRTQSTKAKTSLLNQTCGASPSVSVSSRSTKQSQRLSLGPSLTSSVRSPLRSARYSAIPEKLSSREDLLQSPISSARFSTNRTIITGANPGGFRDSVDYFESASREPRGNDDVEMVSENRSIFSSPARHSVSSLHKLPRSSALEEEFAMHDAMMDTSQDNSKVTLIAPATKENMDATDLLFLSHALTIKSFSERKQMEVKRRIAQIIAQAEIDEMA